MEKVKCIIVDSDPQTVSVLETYIRGVEALRLCAVFYNAVDALMYLQQYEVDIIFLEAELPRVSGAQFMACVPSRPFVIFLAGPDSIYVEQPEIKVLDFLPKPIPELHFLEAVNSYFKATSPRAVWQAGLAYEDRPRPGEPYSWFRVNNLMAKIYLKDILYIECFHTSFMIRTVQRKYIANQPVAILRKRLPPDRFLRIHRSFIVARERITGYTQVGVKVDKYLLPIGRHYRKKMPAIMENSD